MLAVRKANNIAGLGPDNDQAVHAHKEAAAAEAWNEFIKVAKFRVGGQARIGGNVVTLTDLKPLTGGRVYVKGTYPGGGVDGQYKPSDLETV